MRLCFGDYIGKTCEGHYKCPFESDCFVETSLKKGYCDCEFKQNCHLSRQYVAKKYNKSNSECWFYNKFKQLEEERNVSK